MRARGGCESLRGWLGEVIRHFKGSPGKHIKRRKEEEDLTTGEGKRKKARGKEEEVDLTRSGPKARRTYLTYLTLPYLTYLLTYLPVAKQRFDSK